MEVIDTILTTAETLSFDLQFAAAKNWKSAEKGRILVGYLPIYIPREIIHAANGLPVEFMGAGDRKQIIKGDAYYQSYICHLPRGIIEMALDTNLNEFDGFLFPAICDCVEIFQGCSNFLKKGNFNVILTIRRISSPV